MLGKRLVVQAPASVPAEDAAKAWGWLHPMAVPCGNPLCSPAPPEGPCASPGPAVSFLPYVFPGGVSNRPLHGDL